MILVTGGTAQGKRGFVERELTGELASGQAAGMTGEPDSGQVGGMTGEPDDGQAGGMTGEPDDGRAGGMTGERDGGRAGGMTGELAGGSPGGRAVAWVDGAAAEPECFLSAPFCHNFQAFVRRIVSGEVAVDLAELAEVMRQARPDRVIVTDEIGGGIVPTDPMERTWREETGRVCCRLAAEAEQVWRVNCGLGQRIK
ncbi:MAG: bifunctional adenosylcobinamide kinase/adenosylcobinamide-phosphate guanylyltransferase [Enterocloster asparagiformis]|nr:bifunctional adenosylcobinamide kinase/adenosylcobinamide-phosphate guanylyltransferase [Enterocloster asparagiformis]